MEFLGTKKKLRYSLPEKSAGLDIDNISDPIALTNNLLPVRSRKNKKKYKYLRMSEVYGACPREWTIGHLTQGYKQDYAGFGNLVAMNFGSALHFWLQNYSPFFGGNLVGYYRCAAWDFVRRFGKKPDTNCENCGALPKATFYKEFMFRLKKPYRVVGKMDGLLKVVDRYRLMEIKTTKEQEITRPFPRDVAQLSGYQNFYDHVPETEKFPVKVDTSVAYLFYFKKMFNFAKPVATFKVRKDSVEADAVIETARLFTDGVETETLPEPLSACIRTSFVSGRAKKCAMGEICKRHYKSGAKKFILGEWKNV